MLLNAGTVGTLSIDIPMTALRTKPIRVHIKDVLISVSPNPSVNVKKAQLEKHLYDWKQLEQEKVRERPP